jgi:hypothetical protein
MALKLASVVWQVWMAHERPRRAAMAGEEAGGVEAFGQGRRHANAAIAGMWAGVNTR